MSEPEIIQYALLGIQVCVPKNYTQEQVEDFANSTYPTGISSSWSIIHDGDERLRGDSERVQCLEREDCVHMILGC